MAIALFALVSARRAARRARGPRDGRRRHEAPAGRAAAGGWRSACVALVAACGEKSEYVGGTVRGAQPRPDARLVPEPRPRRDLPGARARATSATSGSTCSRACPPTPPRRSSRSPPGRADLAISYEPEVLPGARAGAAGGRGRRARAAAADLADGDRQKSGVRSVRDLRGKRVGTAGIPYQAAYLKTILRARERARVLGEGDQRRRQPAAGDAVRQGRRDAGRVLERRGRRAAPARASARGSSPSTGSACPTTTSWCWSPTRTSSTSSRDDLRLFISARRPRRARGARGPARGGRRRCSTPTTT